MVALPFVARTRSSGARRHVPRCSHSIRQVAGGTSAAVRPQRVDGADRDVLHRAGRVDADQLALGAVVVDERRGLLGVLPQPGGDGLRLVVVALEQLARRSGRRCPPGWSRRTRRARSCRSPGTCAGRTAAGSPRRRRRPAPGPGPARCRGRRGACPARRPADVVRGKPSSRKPSLASGSASRSRTMLMVTSSGTSLPASMYRLASTPRGVPWETFARKMSPVEIFGTERCAAMNSACVPLPAPGGPTRTSRIYRRNPS